MADKTPASQTPNTPDLGDFFKQMQTQQVQQQKQQEAQQAAFQKSLTDTLGEMAKGFSQHKPDDDLFNDDDITDVNSGDVQKLISRAMKPLEEELEKYKKLLPELDQLKQQFATSGEQIIKAAVPNLPQEGGDFDKLPMVEGVPLTWGDYRKQAFEAGDMDALRSYTAQHGQWKGGKEWEEAPSGAQARNAPPSQSGDGKQIDDDQFQADQLAVLKKEMTKDAFEKKYANVTINQE